MWRRRLAEQVSRTEAAKASVAAAREETARSRERQREARAAYIEPMLQAGEHNQFTLLIRKTLPLIGDNDNGEHA